uniref:uncharacterized protein LOC127062191 n=1 Tax=Vespula vulgaris TaxID=7454 RepID=UPI00223BEDDA|nr:uncharacterized protein LOC127062191 [Vespula vulgaris]
MERWVGKVAAVTGASAGIGAAIARQLVTNGMTVAGLARRTDKIEELASSLEGAPGKLHAIECDVTKEESTTAAFSWIEENLGSLDLMINNAGIAKESSLTEGSLEDWRAVFEVNVLGVCLTIREATRLMRKKGEDGLIINIGSLAGERVPAVPGFGVYPSSKRALATLAQTLRNELGGTKIRVTNISPGLVATELLASYSAFSDEVLAAMPSLKGQDVADAVSYVLSTPSNVVLKYIWSYEEMPTRCRVQQELNTLYKEAFNYVKNNENLSEASKLITKMLKHDPKSHKIYALRGTIFEIQGKWTKAINNYEIARLMLKLANVPSYEEADIPYIKSLIKCYEARGDCYYEHELFLQAASDYERIVTLKPPDTSIIDVEYDAFCSYWNEFMQNSNAMRLSDLLTLHAKYKFFLRDIELTREFLLEALTINENNKEAQKLLQKIYELSHTMAVHAVMWCMHRCYDKALYTIAKVSNYNPSNLEYILLKAIILRLSGRFKEALALTENIFISLKMEWSGLDKVAVVTGATSGIGKAIVELLVSKGLKVVGLAHHIDKLNALAEELKSKPGKLLPLQCDLTNQNEVMKAIEWIEKNVGFVNILINNAALNLDTGFFTGEIEDWEKIFDLNILGLTYITKEILKLMKKKGIDNGCIVNVNDIFGLKVPINSERPASPAYICSKFALTALTECLRLELAQLESNIKVISISPGLVETEMTQQWLKENPRLALQPKDVADAILFTLQTPENVLVKDLIITPLREI